MKQPKIGLIYTKNNEKFKEFEHDFIRNEI